MIMGLEGRWVGSQAHRHHDIFRSFFSRRLNEATAVGIGERNLNLFATKNVQYIQEVGHIEADFEGLTLILDFEIFFRFLLLRIVGGGFERPGTQVETHTSEFLIRQNRRSL